MDSVARLSRVLATTCSTSCALSQGTCMPFAATVCGCGMPWRQNHCQNTVAQYCVTNSAMMAVVYYY